MDKRIVPLGHISGVHGVRGWVKVHSLTEPREAIFDYQPWLLGEALEAVRVSEGRKHGNRLIARLEGVDSREAAEERVNRSIAVYREQLPETGDDRFYWTDLVGLTVRLEDGRELGAVERLMATGANDVLVVRGEQERLIPFVPGQYVKQVDLDKGEIVVDWDPDF
ncbi:MAG: ribosome maturation factor RimM [Xanthomonadales bacterium]